MICVVFVPRSGSRFFSQQIAKQTGYDCLGEVLNPRTYPDADFRKNMLAELSTHSQTVIKLGFWQSSIDHLKSLLYKSEKIYFCARSDFNQQVKSFYAATSTNVDNFHADIEHADITYDPERFNSCAKWLESQYIHTAQILKDFKVETVMYESFATKQGKYARNFTWNQQSPQINFDVNKIVNEINDLQT